MKTRFPVLTVAFAALAFSTLVTDAALADETQPTADHGSMTTPAPRALHEAIAPLVAEPSAPIRYTAHRDEAAKELADAMASDTEPQAEKAKEHDPFLDYARPVSNLNFNHPFIWSEVRPVAIHQRFPETSALGGGNAAVYGVQIWLALNDYVQFVADKDGRVELNPDNLPDENGWTDFAVGFKFRVYQDREEELAVAAGVIYETTSGEKEVFQGRGSTSGSSSGIWDLFGSVAKTVGPDIHLIGTAGLEIPGNQSENTRSIHWHLHADKEVLEGFWPLIEVNGYHYLSDAHRDADLGAPLDFEGFDLTSFGSSDVKGNDVVTMAAGFRYELFEGARLGFTYERPITSRKDLFKDRMTLDITFQF